MAQPNPKEHVEAIAKEVGLALRDFTNIELAITHLFAMTLKHENERVPYAMMQAIVSFEGRVHIMRNTMSEAFPTFLPLTWRKLIAHTLKIGKKRNEIAHFTIVQSGGEIPSLEPYWTVMSIGSPNRSRLILAETQERRKEFDEVAFASWWFNWRLQRWLAGHEPISNGPDRYLIPRLRMKDDQTLEEFPPLPQS